MDIVRKLALLDYPRLSSFSLEDANEVVMLVSTMEDRFVRILDVDKRAPLRKGGEAWHAAFSDYLVQAGCPYISPAHPYDRAHMREYVRWLVGNAISLAFEDNAETINRKAQEALAEMTSAPSSSSSSAASSSSSSSSAPSAVPKAARPAVTVSPEATKLIGELAAMLNVSVEGRDALQTLQAVHRAIRQRVLPALSAAGITVEGGVPVESSSAASSSSSSSSAVKLKGGSLAGKTRRVGPAPYPLPASSSSSSSAAASAGLEAFPAGVSTGDSLLDQATSVLRMLYVEDLRELQDAVNDILVTVQEYTANPKTDSSLGAVGR